MPIYEYECPKCGRFEVVQKASERPLHKKPECSDSKCPGCAKRLISAAAFHLKGSGWYKTDYAKSGGASDSSSSASANGSSTKTSKKEKTESSTAKSKDSSTPKTSCGPGCGCH